MRADQQIERTTIEDKWSLNKSYKKSYHVMSCQIISYLPGYHDSSKITPVLFSILPFITLNLSSFFMAAFCHPGREDHLSSRPASFPHFLRATV